MRNGPIALVCFALLGCQTAPAAPAPAAPGATPSVPDAGLADAGLADAALPAPTCEEQIAARELGALTSRHEAYARALPEVIVHARLDPVLFLRWPDERPRSEAAAALRRELEASRRPARDVRAFVVAHADDRALLREVLLSDGYLFSDRPELAVALSSEVRLVHLFDAPRIYRARDGVIDVLERGETGYLESDGSVASVRLHDRVSVDEPALADPLGLDLEVVREETGALRTIPTAIGATAAALDLVFPDGARRASLVEIRDARTEVVCIGGDAATLDATRADAARFWERHRALTSAARALVEESPRFDEPSDEPEGVQEDGELRMEWTRAYLRGESTFWYGTVEYPVFDSQGRAVPPEVCVDFVLDAWERGGGTWYRGEGERPGRTSGAIDVNRAGAVPRRNLTGLLAYAEGEGSVFDRYDVPSEDRVALARGPAYAQAIARQADAFREGDALVVYGLRLQDMHMHHHALLVIRTDPMTGVPMVVADNQGRPQLRSLANAMQAAPLRSIHHRLRLDASAVAPSGA
jgi:hypothetical protein